MADNNLTTKEEFLLNPVEEHNITDAAVASFETNLKHPLKVTVPITPIQDLHGMPNPYPAGASVNLIPDGTDTSNGYIEGYYLMSDGTTIANSGLYISEYIQLDAETTYTWSNRINTSINPAICFYDENKEFISGININSQYSHTFVPPEGTVYCRSSQTTYAYQEANPAQAAYQLEVGSTATEYRRHSNICPISGITKCEIVNVNPGVIKNYLKYSLDYNIIQILPYQSGVGSPSQSNIRPISYGFTFTKDDGTVINLYAGRFILNNNGTSSVISTHGLITMTGVETSDNEKINGTAFYSKGSLATSDEYYTGISNSVAKQYSTQQNISGNYCSHGIDIGGSETVESVSMHTWYTTANPATGRYQPRLIFPKSMNISTTAKANAWLRTQYNNGTPVQYTFLLATPITYNLTVSETKRLILRQVAISWESDIGTIYGGKIIINTDGSADLSSRWVMRDMSTFSDISYYGSNRFRLRNWSNGGYDKSGGEQNLLCDVASIKWASENYTVYGQLGTSSIFVRDDTISTVEEFKVKYKGHYIAYDSFRNYKTYHFPNVGQLKAFLGENNVWSDIGNVDVKYLTQHSETGLEYRGDRALELRRRAMMADAPTIHTTVGSEETGGLASFKGYVKAPVKKIEIPFYPKQDLHGMPNPYPAGASVNLIPDGTDTSKGYVSNAYLGSTGIEVSNANFYVSECFNVDPAITYTWTDRGAEENPCIAFYDENYNLLSVIKNNNAISHTFNPPEGAVYARSSQTTEAYQEKNPTGAAFQLEIGSISTEYRKYSNVCPIEGHDGCDIYHNAILELRKDPITNGGITYTFLDWHTVSVSGTSSSIAGTGLTQVYVAETNKIYIDCNPGISNLKVYLWDQTTKTNISGTVSKLQGAYNVTVGHEYVVGTRPNNAGLNCACVFTCIASKYPLTSTLPLTFNQSGDHSFLPIQEGTGDPSPENVRPIHPGLTFTRDDNSVLSVYGGTLTVNTDGTGAIASEWAMAEFDGSDDETWTFSTQNRAYIKVTPLPLNIREQDGLIVCNRLYGSRTTASTSLNRAFIYGDDVIGFHTDSTLTVNNIREWLQLNPLQMCYKLATPITYTLSVTETNRALEALGFTQHIGPLYGGTITINPDGSADVDSVAAAINLGDCTFYDDALSSPINGVYRFVISNMRSSNDSPNLYSCSHYDVGKSTVWTATTNWEVAQDFMIKKRSTYNHLWIKDTSLANKTAAEVKEALSGVLLCYPLATPQTYHFSNLEQLKVWLGGNNFWCDISDDITVKYLNRG